MAIIQKLRFAMIKLLGGVPLHSHIELQRVFDSQQAELESYKQFSASINQYHGALQA